MKTENSVRLFVLLVNAIGSLLACSQIHAQSSTNTTPDTFSFGGFGGGEGVKESWYRDCRRLLQEPYPEILPAPQDIEGNWGPPADGFQLSVRLRHREFLRKEPVVAVIILRNLNLTPRVRAWGVGINAFQYTLHHGTNTLTWVPKEEPRSDTTGNAPPYYMPAKCQIGIAERLDRLFDLNSLGKYSVEIRFLETRLNPQGTTNVTSGAATFQIVEKLSPSEIAARKAHAEILTKGERLFYELPIMAERQRAAGKTNASSSETGRPGDGSKRD